MSPSFLTSKQLKIYEFIEKNLNLLGRPPSLREIAKHFGYSAIGTVQDHIQALIKKGVLEKTEGVVCGLRPSHRSETLTVPILGSVPAGTPLEALDSAMGSLALSSRWRGDLFALKVAGDSMINAGIMDGDFVVVKKQPDAFHGEIVVALIDGEATVKRLEKRGKQLRLLPENPKYKPIELNETRRNSIQGKVVAVQRFYEKK